MAQDPLIQAVNNLPEVYQKIYTYGDRFDSSRDCADREEHILAVCNLLENNLRRKLRILDLGCAQGYFSLSLASLGHHVFGVDFLKENISVCNAIKNEFPNFDAEFEHADFLDVIPSIESGKYDLVLGLSVFHHTVHGHGIEFVQNLIEIIAKNTLCAIYELAVKNEDVYWAESLPVDWHELIASYSYFYKLGQFKTHLSHVSRPLVFASNSCWYLQDKLVFFDSVTSQSHRLVGGAHGETRRYYFSNNCILKHYRLDNQKFPNNLLEITSEYSFLSENNTPDYPKVIAFHKTETDCYFARELYAGENLLDVLEKEPIDKVSVFLDVVSQLADFEEKGFFHSDLRVWNVVYTASKKALLIDFGALSRIEKDCTWPYDLAFSLWIFACELFGVIKITPDRHFVSIKKILSDTYPFKMELLLFLGTAPSGRSFKSLLKNLLESKIASVDDQKVELPLYLEFFMQLIDVVENRNEEMIFMIDEGRKLRSTTVSRVANDREILQNYVAQMHSLEKNVKSLLTTVSKECCLGMVDCDDVHEGGCKEHFRFVPKEKEIKEGSRLESVENVEEEVRQILINSLTYQNKTQLAVINWLQGQLDMEKRIDKRKPKKNFLEILKEIFRIN